jgi:hypothetical protein
MFRNLIVLAALTAGDAAIASISVPPRPVADRADRPALAAQPAPKPVAMPAQPYQITPQTEVLLDGRPADYCSIPEGARIEYLEVTPDGVILKVHFLSPAPRR